MIKDAISAMIKAHIPGCDVISVTVAGNDSKASAAVTVAHGKFLETFAVQITSVDVRVLTEEEQEEGIALSYDESMRHCY